MGSLVSQLLSTKSGRAYLASPQSDYLKSLRQRHLEIGNVGSPPLDVLVAVLEWLSMATYQRVYVIIDGLDECQTRKELLIVLMKLANNKLNSRLNLLITSRPEEDIKSAFNGRPNAEMDPDGVRSDIQSYVTWILDHHHNFNDVSKDLKLEIKETLVEKSDGMYVLFKMVLMR